jgi:predicted ATPase
MNSCRCGQTHTPRRIVITGGPGAGKTAVLELLRRYVCSHTRVLPESAGIVFGGGFPRGQTPTLRRTAQRAIYYVQRELERAADDENLALTLCDRGTLDGLAYWFGEDDLLTQVGSSLSQELARYDVVIHLRTPALENGYNHDNPLRIESAHEAAAIDQRILAAWQQHPRRFVVDSAADFLTKAAQVIGIVRAETPACCQPNFKVTASIPMVPMP